MLFYNKDIITEVVHGSLKLPVSTPEELLEWMDRLEYGWIGKDGTEHSSPKGDSDIFEKWWDEYALLLPKDVAKKKIGTCYEQTIFAAHVFKTQFEIQHKLVHIQQYLTSNHAFLVFKRDRKWYHFEHSFAMFRGIHGPFNSVKEIAERVYVMMNSHTQGGHGFEWHYMDPKKFKKKMSAREFYREVKYNWKYSEGDTSKEPLETEPKET